MVKRIVQRTEDDVVTDQMIDAGGKLILEHLGVDGSDLALLIYNAMREARPKYSLSDKARFFQKVHVAGPDDCWIWHGAFKDGGYGKIGHRDKTIGAHVMSWEMANNQTVTKGFVVRHHCDNPPCVNPAHLEPGTYAQNMKDMWRRGRARPNGLDARGSRNACSKHTEADVVEIRKLFDNGVTKSEIAKKFGVTVANVCYIVARKSWTHVP